ncbi:MAG: hypothetical protein WA789_06525 [Candidatus Acidiferrum sp.]
MSTKRQDRIRRISAWLCLLAATLLYAPLAGAAWMARNTDCCAGGYCPIAARHQHKQQIAPPQNSSPMDCGHDMNGMGGTGDTMSCSVSCCPDQARPALIPGTFLLPPASVALVSEEVSRPVQVKNSLELSRFVQPLSPPPRFAVAAL